MSDTLYLSTEALSDLVCYQRETIRQLRNQIDRAKLNAEVLDSEQLANTANAANEVMRMVPQKLIDELKESLQ